MRSLVIATLVLMLGCGSKSGPAAPETRAEDEASQKDTLDTDTTPVAHDAQTRTPLTLPILDDVASIPTDDTTTVAREIDATTTLTIPGLSPEQVGRLANGTPGCVALSKDGRLVLSIVARGDGAPWLRFADVAAGEGRFAAESGWPLTSETLRGEPLRNALAGRELVACREVAGPRAVVPRPVPVSVSADEDRATVAIEGNLPLTIDLRHDVGRWAVESIYYADGDVGGLYLRLRESSGGEGGGDNAFALAHVEGFELGWSRCVPRPLEVKPLPATAPPAFSASPPEASCVAMTPDGQKAAFKTWRIGRMPGEPSAPNAIAWFGPGAVEPDIDLSCLARKRCSPEQQAALEARAAELGLVGCAVARGALVVDGKLASFMYKDDAVKLLGGSGWRGVHELTMGVHDGEPHESLWKVFQLPSGGPIYLYIGDQDTGYETVIVRVLDEAAMQLCPAPPPDALAIAEVRASSSQRAGGRYRFTPQQAIDGDLTTSWQPALKKGDRPWIELALDGEHEVSAIDVANGFQRRDGLGDLFVMNARAAEVTITFSDGTSEHAQLTGDARDYQTLSVKPHRTESVRITVLGTYPGTRWPEDIALSELRVRGR